MKDDGTVAAGSIGEKGVERIVDGMGIEMPMQYIYITFHRTDMAHRSVANGEVKGNSAVTNG